MKASLQRIERRLEHLEKGGGVSRGMGAGTQEPG